MIGAVLDRLKAQCASVRLFGRIADLAALDASTGAPKSVPAVFVFVNEEAAAENERINGLLQRNELDVALLIIARNLTDAAGGAAAADIDALRDQVRGALLGWSPDGYAPFEAVSGRIVGVRAGYLRYEIILSTAHYLEAS